MDRDIQLVPRMKDQGYSAEQIERRRRWVEELTGGRLEHVAATTLDGESMRGNIENPIGAAQVPLGVAGPLKIHGQHADGVFYVPLATTEGALVRSYERGMVTLSRAGGVAVRVFEDQNRVSPIFSFPDVVEAYRFCGEVAGGIEGIRAAAEATTGHGKLRRLTCHPLGRTVIVEFSFTTGDAHGMNMVVRATDAACRWLVENTTATSYEVFSGHSAEKRAAGSLLAGGKGKKVVAGALIPARLTRTYLNVEPEQLAATWRRTVLGHLQTAAVGYNGHYANGLTALFIALGQDVANVVDSAVGITDFELTADGDLHVSVTLPSLSLATVGGGTGLATSRECLRMLGCEGEGKARKLAEIVAATLLAGEVSFGAAIAAGDMVTAHETYGRNRPDCG
jgi:hydroxymethylglutaryl-CoA reductase (NADPH)